MRLTKVLDPASDAVSFTLFSETRVVEPAERYLQYLADTERSPNTIKAHAHERAPRSRQPTPFPPHTPGTRSISLDVPQEVVRRILDHDSHQMTANYARLSDTTIRRHWEAAWKVNASGLDMVLDPDGPLAEAAWSKQRFPLPGRCPTATADSRCKKPVHTPTPA